MTAYRLSPSLLSLMISTLFLPLILLTSCGDGGGGNDSSPRQEGDFDSRGIKIIHGAIDLEPVKLSQADRSLVARFARPTGYRKLERSSNEEPWSLTVNNLPTAEISSPSFRRLADGFDSDSRVSVLIYQFNGEARLSIGSPSSQFKPDSGHAGVRLANALLGSDQVELEIDSTSIASSPYGRFSEYVDVSAGTINLEVKSNAGQRELLLNNVEVNEGEVYTVWIAGERESFVRGGVEID